MGVLILRHPCWCIPPRRPDGTAESCKKHSALRCSSPQRSPRRGVEWLAEPPARLQRPEDNRHGHKDPNCPWIHHSSWQRRRGRRCLSTLLCCNSLTGSLLLKLLKTSGVGAYVNVRGCYSFKYTYREI